MEKSENKETANSEFQIATKNSISHEEIHGAEAQNTHLVDVEQAIILLQISRPRLSQLTQKGMFHVERHRVGIRFRLYYKRAEILEFIRTRTTATARFLNQVERDHKHDDGKSRVALVTSGLSPKSLEHQAYDQATESQTAKKLEQLLQENLDIQRQLKNFRRDSKMEVMGPLVRSIKDNSKIQWEESQKNQNNIQQQIQDVTLRLSGLHKETQQVSWALTKHFFKQNQLLQDIQKRLNQINLTKPEVPASHFTSHQKTRRPKKLKKIGNYKIYP